MPLISGALDKYRPVVQGLNGNKPGGAWAKRYMTLSQPAAAAIQRFQNVQPQRPRKSAAAAAGKLASSPTSSSSSLSLASLCTAGYTIVRESSRDFIPTAACRQRGQQQSDGRREQVAVLRYCSAGKGKHGRELGRLELTSETRVSWGKLTPSKATGGRAYFTLSGFDNERTIAVKDACLAGITRLTIFAPRQGSLMRIYSYAAGCVCPCCLLVAQMTGSPPRHGAQSKLRRHDDGTKRHHALRRSSSARVTCYLRGVGTRVSARYFASYEG